MESKGSMEGSGSEGAKSQSEEAGEGSGPMKMGMGMVKKMMAEMGSDGMGAIGMMKKKMMGDAHPDEDDTEKPMQKMMGMCREMLASLQKTTEMAAFSTPELRALFEEWLTVLESDALTILQKEGEMETGVLAAALKISPESAALLITRLVKNGKGTCRIKSVEESTSSSKD